MAQRFGGKYSPSGESGSDQGSFRGATRTRAGGRVNFLFIAPLPLIWKAFTSSPVGMAQYHRNSADTMQVQRHELAAGLLHAHVQHRLAGIGVAETLEVVQAAATRHIRNGLDIKNE